MLHGCATAQVSSPTSHSKAHPWPLSLRTLPLSLLTCLSKSRSGEKNSTLPTGQVILSTSTCDLSFSLRGRAALPREAPHSTSSPKQMRELRSGLPTPPQPPWKLGSIWHSFFCVSMSSPLAPSHQYLFNVHFQKEQKQTPPPLTLSPLLLKPPPSSFC